MYTKTLSVVLTMAALCPVASFGSHELFDRQKNIRAQLSHDLDFGLQFIKPDGGRFALQTPAFEPKNTCGNNMALPDLVPTFYTPDLYSYGGDQVFYRTRKFNPKDPTDADEVADGCVGGFGKRKLMRMNLGLANLGNADVVIGDPTKNPDWEYNQRMTISMHQSTYSVFSIRVVRSLRKINRRWPSSMAPLYGVGQD